MTVLFVVCVTVALFIIIIIVFLFDYGTLLFIHQYSTKLNGDHINMLLARISRIGIC